MSAAQVEFLNLDGSPCPAGQRPARFSFRCVGHNRGKDVRLPGTKCENLLLAENSNVAAHGIKRDGQGLNGGRPQWDWDGNRENPTLKPSINCEKDCGWHGYIVAGRCVDTDGTDSR